jgi:probable phosphoglycerate mutase
MTTIYLIRHAEAEGNLYRRIHGQYDSLLTETGKRQALALAERFREIPLSAVYTSDLFRAEQTAKALCTPHGIEPRKDRRLREQGVGEWEDVCYGWAEHFQPEELKRYVSGSEAFSVDGSELPSHAARRFLAVLRESAARHEGQFIALVTHSMILSASLRTLFPDLVLPRSDNTGVTTLQYSDGTFSLISAGDCRHLSKEISTLERQRWWRETGRSAEFNLWFRPYDLAREPFLSMREDAWAGIYGSTMGLDGEGFYQELLNICHYHPDAAAYAMLGDRTVGFIQLMPAKDRMLGCGHISFVYLIPEERNKGLGPQLIGYATSVFRRKNRKKLQLLVAPQNAHALHVYEKLGFQKAGNQPGRFNDLYLMRKRIDPASEKINWQL